MFDKKQKSYNLEKGTYIITKNYFHFLFFIIFSFFCHNSLILRNKKKNIIEQLIYFNIDRIKL